MPHPSPFFRWVGRERGSLLPPPTRKTLTSSSSWASNCPRRTSAAAAGFRRKHRPDLRAMPDLPLEHDVPSIRRPRWKVVDAGLVRRLQPVLAGNIHHVDVLPAGIAGTVFAVPTARPAGRRSTTMRARWHSRCRSCAARWRHPDPSRKSAARPSARSQMQAGCRCADSTPAKHPSRTTSCWCSVAAANVGHPDIRMAPRAEENAIFSPSADHAGDWLLPPACPPGKLTSAPGQARYMRIAHPSPPSDANAIRELSGEMRGEIEMLPRCVTACWFCAVVIHGPDFFRSSAIAHEINLGFGDAVDPPPSR
jgi:hypothetical protein